jgi:hypothetical protein
MSKTYRHVEHAKLRKEQRSDPLRHYPQPSINNQYQTYYGPQMASDLKIDIRSWDCTVAMRSKHGGKKLRRIRRGARRTMRMALQQRHAELPDYKLPVRYFA